MGKLVEERFMGKRVNVRYQMLPANAGLRDQSISLSKDGVLHEIEDYGIVFEPDDHPVPGALVVLPWHLVKVISTATLQDLQCAKEKKREGEKVHPKKGEAAHQPGTVDE